MTDRTALIGALGPILRNCVLDPESGCWLWQGGRDDDGYAEARVLGRVMRLHKLMVLARGIDLSGKVIHHTCNDRDRRHCLAPTHLAVMTRGDHQRLHARLRREAAA